MKLTKNYKVKAGSRELFLQPDWNFPARTDEEELDLLQKFALAVTARMQHCADNLLHNQSDVIYNDGRSVIFADKTRFSEPAYKAMQNILDNINAASASYELAAMLTTYECTQLIKAVATDEELLNIALEIQNACIQMEQMRDLDEFV